MTLTPADMQWTLVAAFLVMFMQLGFGLVASGFSRAQNVAHTISSGILLYVIGLLGYWACGFAIESGRADRLALGAAPSDTLVLTLFFLHAVVMATAIVIPTGALAERWRFTSLALFGCAMSALVYPLYAHWIWGGGWLARLGRAGLGHGVVDVAGSSVVHMLGGVAGLAGAIVVGPRMRKFTRDGRALAIPGHNIPMAMAGTLILGFGWLGLTTGLAPAIGGSLALVAINTVLASAAAAAAATAYVWWRFGTPDPSIISNGFLAGLVAISAGCALVGTTAAIGIGLVAGVLVVVSVFFVERNLRLDDPSGAISIHGTCGLWGMLAVGLLANGTAGDGLNGVPGPVRGLFYGDASQLAVQALGAVACAAYAFAVVFALFKLFGVLVGNRVSPEAELEGLDVSEMGTVAYPDFSLAPGRHEPGGFFTERPH
jgi:Amt family ammonium transporter